MTKGKHTKEKNKSKINECKQNRFKIAKKGEANGSEIGRKIS